MQTRNLSSRTIRRALATIAIAVFAIVCGCSRISRLTNPAPALPEATATAGIAPVKIEINYEKRDDTLQTFTVTQYGGVSILSARSAANGEVASIARFEGGVPIWRFSANRTLPGIGASQHVVRVEYGNVPIGFSQDVPDSGPPAPLDPGYYIFTIERASGAVNYEALKINPDGSLQGYSAEPRAGSSFSLCCNVSADFAESASPHGSNPASAAP